MSIKENVSHGNDTICRNSADLVDLRRRVLNIEEQLPAIRQNAGMPRFVNFNISEFIKCSRRIFLLKRDKKYSLVGWGAGVTMPG